VLALAVLVLARPVLAMALLALGRLPGQAGRTCRAAGRAVAPALVLRLLAGAASLAVGVLPAVATTPAGATTVSAAAGSPGNPSPGWVLDRVATAPEGPPPAGRSADPPGSRTTTHLVVPGDCLWDLAAHQLGQGASDAAIDRQWRRWYRLNRDAIGSDPDLILPGQVLTVPGVTA
jgi:nucleoid-associated protein YgaU